MSRIIRKIAKRELLRTPGRFIAVFLIIVLGAGYLAGLQSAGPGMLGTANHYFSEKRLADFWLYCDKGITEKDVEMVRALPDVAEASGSYRVDLSVFVNETAFRFSLRSLPRDAAQGGEDYLAQLDLVEGRLPTSATECVADPSASLKIGDTVVVSENNWKSSLDFLSQKKFTVVGLAWSSLYVSTDRGSTNIGNGRIDQYLYVSEEAFSSDWYTELAVRLTTTEGLSAFSPEYEQAIDAANVKLQNFTNSRAAVRFHEISNEVADELNEGEATLESEKSKAETELEAAKKELEEGTTDLNEAIEEYARQEKILTDSRARLSQAKRSLTAKTQELNAQKAVLDEGRRAYQEGRDALIGVQTQRDALWAALAVEPDPIAQAVLQAQIGELDVYIATLEGQIATSAANIAAGEQQIIAAESALASAEADIRAGDRQLAAGVAALNAFSNQIDEAREAINSGTEEYTTQAEAAYQELMDAREELDAGWRDWQAIEWPKWTLQDRDDLPGYSSFSSDVDRINNLSLVLPWFFFFVAAIVCLTTMTRLVEEHRGQIGTLKANGYRRSQIMAIYQSYAWIIGLSGGAIGVVAGLLVYPPAIWNAYSQYHMGAFEIVVTLVPCVIGFLGGAVALSIATAIACRNTLDKNASELMRPRAPRRGKRVLLERVPFLWRRVSFSHKATLRNLLRYKTRFAVTVIGVAGCTALLVAGFGLRDSISGIVDLQYGEISSSQASLFLENPSNASEDTELNRMLDEGDITFSYVCSEDIVVTYEGRTNKGIPTFLSVAEDTKSYTNLIHFRQPANRASITFPLDESQGSAVIITEQLATALGVRIGDLIEFGPNGAEPIQAKIGAISENYIYNYIYLSPTFYKTLVGETAAYNTVVMRSDLQEDQLEALLTDLVATDEVATVQPVSQLRIIMNMVIDNLSGVIWLMILAALMLAVIVIYNLITINVTERERELATLKVLGYHRREVAGYITREAFIMVFFGILGGLFAGVFLHTYVMGVLVAGEGMFPHVIEPTSFVFAGVIPLLCTFLVNLFIRPRLNRLDPATSLKSIE
ncbi:MAG: ABC transporter permease [Coriobacteriales bacterium]|jgi:putative ABC transport system permease protein|nr:ABC transporter permease [Coriobacteriales bacterium]